MIKEFITLIYIIAVVAGVLELLAIIADKIK